MKAKSVQKSRKTLHKDENGQSESGKHNKHQIGEHSTEVTTLDEPISEHHCPKHIGQL